MCRQDISVLVGVSLVLGLALPELALWGTGCVSVVWGGAEGALLAAVLDEEEFEEDGDEEEDAVGD